MAQPTAVLTIRGGVVHTEFEQSGVDILIVDDDHANEVLEPQMKSLLDALLLDGNYEMVRRIVHDYC